MSGWGRELVVGSTNILTMEQLAEKFGISKQSMHARIQKLGLKPVVESQCPTDLGVGGKPAFYDESAYNALVRLQ